MNPYWINPSADTDEFLHSDRIKRQFFLLVAGHILLWIGSFAGLVFIYFNAQSAPQIEAFTAGGEPAFGQPQPVGMKDTVDQQEKFLDLHLRSVFAHLFMRTEKGALPALADYVSADVLAIIDRDFNFAKTKKGGYSQAFFIQDFEKLLGDIGARRRVYRIRGILSAHSMEGSSNTPVYLLARIDRQAATRANPLGWNVTAVLAVDSKSYYNKERQALIEEVTRVRETPTAKDLKDSPKNP